MIRTAKIRLAFIAIFFAINNFLHWVLPNSWLWFDESFDFVVYDSGTHLHFMWLYIVIAGLISVIESRGKDRFWKWAKSLSYTFAGVQVMQVCAIWIGFSVKGYWDVLIVTIYFLTSSVLALGLEFWLRWKQANRGRIGPRF